MYMIGFWLYLGMKGIVISANVLFVETKVDLVIRFVVSLYFDSSVSSLVAFRGFNYLRVYVAKNS